MSGIVNVKPQIGYNPPDLEDGLAKCIFKDEVFSGPREGDIKQLNEKFQMMKTMEMQDPGAVTDLILNPMMNPVAERRDPEQSRKLFNINDSKCDIFAGVKDYAAEAALNTIDEGIRESATFTVFSHFKVPQIVVDSVSDVENSSSHSSTTKSSISTYKLRQLPHCEIRRKSKSYFRPYCIINRRHYTCRSFTHRHRKYGVSQKNSGLYGVDELTHMLGRMGTNESKVGKSGKWQYSPPPKICCLQYRPPVGLSEIKEKSRSMNDLNFEALNISSPSKTSKNALRNESMQSPLDFLSFSAAHDSQRKNEDLTLPEKSVFRLPVEKVLKKLNGLNMEGR